jgi:hypothetical protein
MVITHLSGAFKNKVQMRLFGPERDELTGGWRKLHNEELHNLYSSFGGNLADQR